MLRVVRTKAPFKYQLLTFILVLLFDISLDLVSSYRTIRIVSADDKISCTDRLLAELRATSY